MELTSMLILIAVVLVVGVAIAVALTVGLTRRSRHHREQRAEQASTLRTMAAGHDEPIAASRSRLENAVADAERAHAEADAADHRVAEAERDLAQEEAQQEDTLREADAIDPHAGSSHDPTATSTATPTATPASDGRQGAHRA